MVVFGPTDQKLWMFEVLRRSMGRAGMCWSQPVRVDYISPSVRVTMLPYSLKTLSLLVLYSMPSIKVYRILFHLISF
jgi:hypothetical protein